MFLMECILEKIDTKTTCYCGNPKSYNTCCFPFLSQELIPETPEQLMRSRYSAFCSKNIEYLIATHHPSMRQPDESDLLNKIINTTQWLGLKILKTSNNGTSQGIGYVEFVAFYKTNKVGQLHENSKFIYENDQWYYLDGVILESLKLARNALCWCGSKKKYKKCHGK